MKISVIIPVYNSEKYLKHCIESVIAQTYENWELIMIDDGSEDNSLSILHEYEKQDSRIKVIHQNNEGPGSARNTGIKHATGDYVVFVDSDDKIRKNYFSLLSQKTEDVIFIDVDRIDKYSNEIKREYMSKYKHITKDSLLRQQMTGKINWGGVRKAVRIGLLLENKIEFSNHKIGEEAIYSFLVLWNAKSFSFIDEPVYEYINRAGSQSSLEVSDPWGVIAIALKKKIVEMDLYTDYANTINAFIVMSTIISLNKLAEKKKLKEYLILARKRERKFRNDIDSKYSIDFRNLDKRAVILYLFLKIRWIIPIYYLSQLRTIVKKCDNRG